MAKYSKRHKWPLISRDILGALIFPLMASEYRVYRPHLNCLHYLPTGARLYEAGKYDEEPFPVLRGADPCGGVGGPGKVDVAFGAGGYYVLRSPRGFLGRVTPLVGDATVGCRDSPLGCEGGVYLTVTRISPSGKGWRRYWAVVKFYLGEPCRRDWL